MEGKISLADVKEGIVDVVDLLKINALMDMQAAMERRAAEQSRGN